MLYHSTSRECCVTTMERLDPIWNIELDITTRIELGIKSFLCMATDIADKVNEGFNILNLDIDPTKVDEEERFSDFADSLISEFLNTNRELANMGSHKRNIRNLNESQYGLAIIAAYGSIDENGVASYFIGKKSHPLQDLVSALDNSKHNSGIVIQLYNLGPKVVRSEFDLVTNETPLFINETLAPFKMPGYHMVGDSHHYSYVQKDPIKSNPSLDYI